MSKVIILNGPAGSGKDAITKYVCNNLGNYMQAEFKEPLYSHVAQAIGMDYDEFRNHYQDREWKESPQYNGHSVRDLMIHTSENYLKPVFGDDYFGHNLVKRLQSHQRWFTGDFIISDGGFSSELEAVVAGGFEVVLIHLHRDGCSFAGDSRNYVLTNSVDRIYNLNNDGTIEEAALKVTEILAEIRNRELGDMDESELINTRNQPRARTGNSSIARTLARAAARLQPVPTPIPDEPEIYYDEAESIG